MRSPRSPPAVRRLIPNAEDPELAHEGKRAEGAPALVLRIEVVEHFPHTPNETVPVTDSSVKSG
jgi:hypothetical protein